jgi:hypothetical protein
MKDFYRLPFEIYRNDDHWVAPLGSEVRRVLDAKKNPYFKNGTVRLFVCSLDKKPVARVAIIINRDHWKVFGERAAFFGFFESFNDGKAVQCLFEAVQQYCMDQGAQVIEGPFNPNHYSELGLQINKFGFSPTFFQTYNPDYYRSLLEKAGFIVSKTVHTRRRENIREYLMQRYGEKGCSTNLGDYAVRTLRMEDLDGELERIREVFNDAFNSNWHFLPLTREEYLFSAKFLRLVTYPELIVIVEHNGEPVGVLECVQDVNPLLRCLKGKVGPLKYLRYIRARKNLRTLVIFAVGIKRAYQHTRVYKLLLDAMRSIAMNYDVLETTWMYDDNVLSIRAAEHLGLEREKEFVILRKQVGNDDTLRNS